MSSPETNPTLADVVAAVAQLHAVVQEAVAHLAEPVTVATTDQATIAELLAQVQSDTAALSVVVPAPAPANTTEAPPVDPTTGGGALDGAEPASSATPSEPPAGIPGT